MNAEGLAGYGSLLDVTASGSKVLISKGRETKAARETLLR